MKKTITTVLLFCVALGAGFAAGFSQAEKQSQAQISKLKGDVAIYKSEAENYARVIRSIRETAQTATITEKAEVL